MILHFSQIFFTEGLTFIVYLPFIMVCLFHAPGDAPLGQVVYRDLDGHLVTGQYSDIVHTELTGYEYAAARDHYGKYLIQPNYINAGVLLFNMKEMRKTGLLKRARALLREKKLVFADQSAILRCTTRKKMLPQRFNDQKFLHKHTVVRHFSKRLFYLPYPHTANIKQWMVSDIHRIFGYYVFDDILYEYIYLKKKYESENRGEL